MTDGFIWRRSIARVGTVVAFRTCDATVPSAKRSASRSFPLFGISA
jgi:hypothetical protein